MVSDAQAVLAMIHYESLGAACAEPFTALAQFRQAIADLRSNPTLETCIPKLYIKQELRAAVRISFNSGQPVEGIKYVRNSYLEGDDIGMPVVEASAFQFDVMMDTIKDMFRGFDNAKAKFDTAATQLHTAYEPLITKVVAAWFVDGLLYTLECLCALVSPWTYSLDKLKEAERRVLKTREEFWRPFRIEDIGIAITQKASQAIQEMSKFDEVEVRFHAHLQNVEKEKFEEPLDDAADLKTCYEQTSSFAQTIGRLDKEASALQKDFKNSACQKTVEERCKSTFSDVVAKVDAPISNHGRRLVQHWFARAEELMTPAIQQPLQEEDARKELCEGLKIAVHSVKDGLTQLSSFKAFGEKHVQPFLEVVKYLENWTSAMQAFVNHSSKESADPDLMKSFSKQLAVLTPTFEHVTGELLEMVNDKVSLLDEALAKMREYHTQVCGASWGKQCDAFKEGQLNSSPAFVELCKKYKCDPKVTFFPI